MKPALLDRIITTYTEAFQSAPELVLRAPGRINLIGEHTDYNMGFVLPAAVQQGVYFAIGRSNQDQHEWTALDKNDSITIGPEDLDKKHGGWIDYLLGGWLELKKTHQKLPKLRCVFAADLPEGAGLSSSSALTCGMLYGITELLKLDLARDEIAWMAHQVERNYVGLRGGIMDQHASMLCKTDHFLLLDCKARSYEHIPFGTEDASIFLINTNVKHNLTETDYNTRADECAQAVRILQHEYPIQSLRDVTSEHLGAMRDTLGPILSRRVHFVLNENARVLHSVSCIQDKKWADLGADLYKSHFGLRTEYEVSCPELDFLVDLVSREEWIYGARMMGGGFGGCVIVLGHRTPDASFEQKVDEKYFLAFGLHPTMIDVKISDGAAIFSA